MVTSNRRSPLLKSTKLRMIVYILVDIFELFKIRSILVNDGIKISLPLGACTCRRQGYEGTKSIFIMRGLYRRYLQGDLELLEYGSV